MPCDYEKYPKDWKAFSLEIRTERARHICECTGECGYDHWQEFENDTDIYADLGIELPKGRCWAMNRTEHLVTGAKVVLTVAHLCKCEPLCAKPSHVKAMCQRCHNKLDAPMRRQNATRTRQEKRDSARALFA